MTLTKGQKQELKKIAEKYKLKLIMLFGSFTNGKNRPDSDFDIAVLAKQKINFNTELLLIKELTGCFKQEVDLAVMNKANPLLLQQVSQSATLLYGKKTDFFNFKLYAFHRYNDYAPFFKMEERFVKRLVKQL